MKTKVLVPFLLFGLMLGIILTPSAIAPASFAQTSTLSIVRMDPDTEQALKAQGKSITYPFPNVNNNGRKFNPSALNLDPLPTPAPVQHVITIFVQFTTPPPGSTNTRLDLGTYFDTMLYGTVYDPPEYAAYPGHPTDRTLNNYWKEVSYDLITSVTTYNMPSTLGWANSGQAYDYYCKADGIHDNGFGPYPQNVQGLVIDAVNAVDAQVDFAQYAVNGEVPNLFVVFAGTGAEWSADPSIIWSHSWDLTEGTGLNGIMRDGVKINKYAMMPEVGGDLTGYSGPAFGPFPPTCGVYAHEYGHVLGLPDQYDYGYESEGTGMYSLMASGSWARYPYDSLEKRLLFSGNSPTHLDAWSKIRLGFVTPTIVSTAITVNLLGSENHPVAYKMDVPNSNGKEYFLLENRQNIGFDISLARYGAHGLAVYHVDETVFARNYWFPNEAENWKEFRSEGARKVWTGETHYAISLTQADDKWDLEHGTNVADSGDLYPGSLGISSLSSGTKPNTSTYYFWKGSSPKFGHSGITIANIQETSNIITASLSFSP
jgi:M6 family metalloprotease-like protein